MCYVNHQIIQTFENLKLANILHFALNDKNAEAIIKMILIHYLIY